MEYFVMVCSFIFLAVMVFLDIFKYFIGGRFHAGLGIVPVLLLANFCLGIYYNLSVWYKLTDRTMAGAWISLFGAAVTVALNFWWIPRWGFLGAAWATFACYFAMMVVGFLFGQKYYPIPYNLQRISGWIVLGLALWPLGRALDGVLPMLARQAWHLAVLGLFAAVALWVIVRGRRRQGVTP